MGDVLGIKKTIIHEPNQLASGLPYQVNVKLDDYADIPDEYRHKWRVKIQSKDGNDIGGTLIEVTKNLVEINDKTLAIHFDPATQQDEDVITSLLPEPDASGDINPEDLPQSLPAYLINMVGNIAIDGQNVTTTSSMPIGTELNLKQGLWDPIYGWEESDSTLNAGEYVALGVDGGQINPKLLQKVQSELEQAKSEIEIIEEQNQNNEVPTIPETLTKHTLSGNIIQSIIISYFAMNNAQDRFADKSNDNIVIGNLPSYGTFGTRLKANYSWGSSLSHVSFAGLGMDVDWYLTSVVSKQNLQQDVIVSHRGIGSRLSAMEHLVPEKVFADETNSENSPQAISAVKSLSIAANAGQKIYSINQSNSSQIQGITADSKIINEITEAVSQGKEVTVHESPISAFGWTGTGYLVIDPTNGTGAYKISGGTNGAAIIQSVARVGDLATVLTMLKELGVKIGKLGGFVSRVLGPLAQLINAADVLYTTYKDCLNEVGVEALLALIIVGFITFAIFGWLIGGLMGLAYGLASTAIWSAYFSRETRDAFQVCQ